jgi:CheY-like chemotaxis protein
MQTDLLVIHPNVRERKRICDLAERAGLGVCEADSPVDGIILAREAAPTAVVLDFARDEAAAFLALQMLRAMGGPSPRHGGGPRVVAVGLREAALQKLASELGVDEVVSKPQELRGAMARLARHRRPSSIGSLP